MRIPASSVPFVRAALGGSGGSWPALGETQTRTVAALRWHGVLPLLSDAIRRGVVEAPEELVTAARDELLIESALSSLLIRERGIVAVCLAEAGVRPVVLKGGSLIGTVYDEPGLRPMADLDFLVAPDAMDDAEAALAVLGYERHIDDAEGYHHHRTLVRPGPGGISLGIELHRRLLASPPYDRLLPTEAVLSRTKVLSGELEALDPFDNLLHISAHAVLQHPGEERLIWVADVDRVARSMAAEPGAWSEVAHRAVKAQLVAATIDALRLARYWFDCVPAEDGAEALRSLGPSVRELSVYYRLRRRAPIGREGARRWADVRGVPGVLPKIRFAAAHALPPAAYMRAWYGLDHAWQLPIYYARRILRGAVHISTEPLRRGRGAAQDPPEAWMVER